MTNVGRQIKRLRTAQHMTQDELAEKLFVSRQTVSNYETGKSNPDVDTLVRIAQIFETDVNCLIYGPQIPPDQRRQRRRIVISVAVTAALAVAMVFLVPWAKALAKRTFIATPGLLVFYIGWPLLMTMTGWTLMELGGYFLRARWPKGRAVTWIRRALIVLLALYGVMAVPFSVSAIRGVIAAVHGASYSGSFSFPLGLNRLWVWMARYSVAAQMVFALMGAGLRITWKEKKTETPPETAEA